MERIKLKDRILPKYTKGEEIFNMTSHIVGAVLGIVATVLCVVFAAIRGNVYGVVSGAIYGVTMIILYTMSSIYHGLSPKRYSKKVFQVLDHCSIFLLIAGSYTPFALCTIREYDTASGWIIFGVIWAAAILGIVLKISPSEWAILSLSVFFVLGSEMMNTALETAVDLTTEEYHIKAKLAKDTAAGAVVLASINAVVVSYFLFADKIIQMFK